MKPYVAAGTLSRGPFLWFVLPLAASVMFPKAGGFKSSAKGQKSDLFGLVVIGTAVHRASAACLEPLWIAAGPLIPVRILV